MGHLLRLGALGKAGALGGATGALGVLAPPKKKPAPSATPDPAPAATVLTGMLK